MGYVLVTSPVGAQAAGYYFHGQPPGLWLGKGAAALHLAGVVEVRPLTAVLRGRHPGTGAFLPTVKPARRRGGWDLILAAPKSVSLLASRPQVGQAHHAAVMGAMAHFESVLARGSGVVAAGFGHVQNAAGEPHLHLVLANLARGADGAWAHLSSCGWWPDRHELSAVYQLGLRHHLREAGLDLDWRMRDDGLADVAGVPRAAIRAASTRSRTVVAEAADRQVAGARLRAGIQRGATALTRRAPDRPPPAPAGPPRVRATWRRPSRGDCS
jgi:conjugative relaxase-like TrwC/TraI family protein